VSAYTVCVCFHARLIYSTSSSPWATASEHWKSNQEGGKNTASDIQKWA